MAYFDIFSLQADTDFINRVSACYVTEVDEATNPNPWTPDHIWQIAAAPGFGEAYESAVLNGVARPGKDQSVISDLQILAAVQAAIAGEALT